MNQQNTRQDYDQIKARLQAYVKLWNTKQTAEEVKAIFSPRVTFHTSTSLTMPDGAQHSLFGIGDFLRDFPFTDTLETDFCNYTCRMWGTQAVSYADVVCKAANADGGSFRYIAVLLATWHKASEGWQIFDLKQEIMPGGGNLQADFAKVWYLDTAGEREPMLQGEADSPWNLLPQSDAPLTEEEQALDCLTKYFYGLEQNVFQHCFDAVSVNFNAYTEDGMGEGRRSLLAKAKKQRQKVKYAPHVLLVSAVEWNGDRAVVHADQLLEELPDYLDSAKRYSRCRQTIELQREADGWKIVYMDAWPGIYALP